MEHRARLSLLILLLAPAAGAKTLLSQKEALALAFGSEAPVERKTVYLTEEQRRAAEKAAQAKVGSRVWTYYVGRSSAGATGYAYFESHVVRTMPETFMAVVEPDGSLRSVELLAFAEPQDYRPSPPWLKQLKGKKAEELWVGRAVRNMTGASITSEAMTAAIRRVLAVHALLHPKGKER